jgi:hypothetical protein
LKTIWVFNRGVEHLRPFQDERCELRKTLVGKRRPRERMPLEVLRVLRAVQNGGAGRLNLVALGW